MPIHWGDAVGYREDAEAVKDAFPGRVEILERRAKATPDDETAEPDRDADPAIPDASAEEEVSER